MLPPSRMITETLPRGTVLDFSGNPVDLTQRPTPDSSQALAGRVRDPWMLDSIADLNPMTLAALMRSDCPYPMQMALCSRMLDRDAKMASLYRDQNNAVSGLDWEILPYDKSGEARRIHSKVEEWYGGLTLELEEAMPLIVAGEYYPMGAVGIVWDSNYIPKRLLEIDPARWYWDSQTNALRIRTLANPSFGEPLPPNEYIRYRSALRPGKGRDGGLWKPAAWLYLIKHFDLSEALQFAEIYGKPFRLGFYEDESKRDGIFKALIDMAANAVGVFPKGTQIELKEAMRGGAVEIYKFLHELCNDEAAELFVGHSLITHAKSGSGTLAGNGAQRVHEKIVQAIARRVSRVLGKYLTRPMVQFQLGERALAKLPKVQLKYQPPTDEQQKAQTYVFVNQVLAPLGLAIGAEQIRGEFNLIETVPRAVAASPADFGGAPGGGAQQPPGDGQPAGPEAARRQARLLAAAYSPLVAQDALEQLAVGLGKQALKKVSAALLDRLDQAPSIEAFMASAWEEYSSYDTTAIASATRDALVTAELSGREGALE
ncbi:MAG: hypothetical protein JWO56_3603 [Acidobacteria bacterium]|nr:hypothetical protein [Acidobacteriota bacterium]